MERGAIRCVCCDGELVMYRGKIRCMTCKPVIPRRKKMSREKVSRQAFSLVNDIAKELGWKPLGK